MASPTLDLWSLVRGRPQIDPHDLADAVVSQVAEEPLDYRTRLLIRDSVDALKGYWGARKASDWVFRCSVADRLTSICEEGFDEVGFPSIKKRLMDKTDPAAIRQYFQALGFELRVPIKIAVGGGCALILPGFISRFTEDINIVGEVPAEIRTKYQLLEDLERLHGLHLGHVQSHYFPRDWHERVHAFGVYNHLQVSLVDVYDVFLSKLFSARVKDMADLTVLLPQLDKDVAIQRFLATCKDFVAPPRLQEIAQKNWYI